MKVKSESEVTESCPTLSDPMDCSLPGSSVRGISQARILEWLEWVAFSFIQRIFPIQASNPGSHIAGRRYYLSHQGSSRIVLTKSVNI